VRQDHARADAGDLGARGGADGIDARLRTGQRDSVRAAGLAGHGEKRDTHLLARRDQLVHLAFIGFGRDALA
jgi:hypothetical protein